MLRLLLCSILVSGICLPSALWAAPDKLPRGFEKREFVIAETKLQFFAKKRQRKLIDRLQKRASENLPRINKALPVDRERPIEIWVFPRVRDYFKQIEQMNQSPVPEWAVGVAVEEDLIVLGARARPSVSEIERTFIHELVHASVEASVGEGNVPRWLHEGVAIYFSDDWTPQQSQRLAEASASDTLMAFREIDSGFPKHHSRASVAYAQSFHFVRFMIQQFGLETLREMFIRMRTESFYTAFEAVTGQEFTGFERRWKKSLPSSISIWSLVRGEAIFFIAVIAVFVMVAIRSGRDRHPDEVRDEDWDYDERAYPLPGDDKA